MKFRAKSAYVAQPNTKETDLMSEVLHKVNVDIDGNQITVVLLAQDPMDAIERVNKMSWSEIDRLPRV
jgi:hypothetical protein